MFYWMLHLFYGGAQIVRHRRTGSVDGQGPPDVFRNASCECSAPPDPPATLRVVRVTGSRTDLRSLVGFLLMRSGLHARKRRRG
jgi:hypothetical protein